MLAAACGKDNHRLIFIIHAPFQGTFGKGLYKNFQVDNFRRPDLTGTDQTRPDQTRPDQTRPDQTRPDQTRTLSSKYLHSVEPYLNEDGVVVEVSYKRALKSIHTSAVSRAKNKQSNN
jgi:hypothetical protein